jgi:hypothetical protein
VSRLGTDTSVRYSATYSDTSGRGLDVLRVRGLGAGGRGEELPLGRAGEEMLVLLVERILLRGNATSGVSSTARRQPGALGLPAEFDLHRRGSFASRLPTAITRHVDDYANWARPPGVA